jgi:hypothetical protein
MLTFAPVAIEREFPGARGPRRRRIQAFAAGVANGALVLSIPLVVWSQQKKQAFSPSPDWRPTFAVSGARYAGTAACESCHKAQASRHAHTGMRGAATTPADCDILRENPVLAFQSGPYAYRIERKGEESQYSVSDGRQTIASPIRWCFGKGEAGQTYILERNGTFHESRVSYFLAVKGLDFTLGAPAKVPASLEEAFGRRMADDDARDCFACHNTAAVSEKRLQVTKMTPGVTCEGCHGAGGDHVSAIEAGRLKDAHVFNPGTLDTEEMSNFCGACHRTWSTVMLMGVQGVGNVRFQPYRIAGSRCYDTEDRRIRCAACHDVHQDRERDPAAYDEKCAACHGPARTESPPGKRAKACPTGKPSCVSCHMPRFELPGSHFNFTDHHIRVVRRGDPYPG